MSVLVWLVIVLLCAAITGAWSLIIGAVLVGAAFALIRITLTKEPSA